MNVAILTESPADEAAIRILINSLLHIDTQQATLPRLQARIGGWDALERDVPVILRALYFTTATDALAVVGDSDDSPVHQLAHATAPDLRCRLCRLRSLIESTLSVLPALPSRPPLRTAVGIAVPAIEAWYLCGIDPHVNEPTWARGGSVPYDRKSLKRTVYGVERPDLELETRHAMHAATRLAVDLSLLEQQFPNGFGPFAADVRGW